MKKKSIIIITVISLPIVILLTLTVFMFLIATVGDFMFSGSYHEQDFEFIDYLEKTFIVEFPKDTTDLRVANNSGWDCDVFVLMFQATPEAVDKFLLSLHETPRLKEYSASSDTRADIIPQPPAWFRTPIQKGSEAIVRVKLRNPREHHSKSSFRVYIDKTMPNKFIVYIRGFYELE